MIPPPIGARTSMTVRVTADLRAEFDDEVVHDVYGTAAIVKHAEQVSRRLFRPCLEPGEEGVGASVSLRHRAPAPVGSTVTLTATVTEAHQRKMVTAVEARRADGTVVATAEFTQVVVALSDWRATLDALR